MAKPIAPVKRVTTLAFEAPQVGKTLAFVLQELQRFSSFAQYFQVLVVGEYPVAPSSRELPRYSEVQGRDELSRTARAQGRP